MQFAPMVPRIKGHQVAVVAWDALKCCVFSVGVDRLLGQALVKRLFSMRAAAGRTRRDEKSGNLNRIGAVLGGTFPRRCEDWLGQLLFNYRKFDAGGKRKRGSLVRPQPLRRSDYEAIGGELERDDPGSTQLGLRQVHGRTLASCIKE